jgi:hypothetical protein
MFGMTDDEMHVAIPFGVLLVLIVLVAIKGMR